MLCVIALAAVSGGQFGAREGRSISLSDMTVKFPVFLRLHKVGSESLKLWMEKMSKETQRLRMYTQEGGRMGYENFKHVGVCGVEGPFSHEVRHQTVFEE